MAAKRTVKAPKTPTEMALERVEKARRKLLVAALGVLTADLDGASSLQPATLELTTRRLDQAAQDLTTAAHAHASVLVLDMLGLTDPSP